MARGNGNGGGMGPIGAVVLTVVVIAVFRLLFGVDLIGYLDTAADWLVGLVDDIVRRLDS